MSFKPKVFDAHSDIPSQVVQERKNRNRNKVIKKDFVEGMEKSNIKSRFLAIYLSDKYIPEKSVSRAIETIEETKKDIEETKNMRLCTSVKEMRQSHKEYNFFLSMEGSEPITNNLSLLDAYYNLGVRSLTLTHSRRNMVGDGVPIKRNQGGSTGGLSVFGKKVVKKCEDLGILIDLSHINEQGFWEVLESTDSTVIASHSNSNHVHESPRNLNDEQLKAIAERGGTIGLVSGVIKFVGENPDINDFMDHLNHVVEVVGVDNVGFGFDYFDYLKKYYTYDRFEREVSAIDGMQDDSEVKNIIPKLQEEGYSKKEIKKICRDNFLESIEKVIG